MKLIAAAQRGSKKDFVDLNYLMKQGMTAELCREALQVKYAGVRWCWPVVVKGLAYFDDAELEPMPVMKVSREAARSLSETEWQNIKKDLTALQVELLQSIRC